LDGKEDCAAGSIRSRVYFIRAGEDGPIKIGVAVRIAERLAALQTGTAAPLSLIREVPGSFAVEAWFHREFKNLHLSGEWFSFDPRMLSVNPPSDILRQEQYRQAAAISRGAPDNALTMDGRVVRWIRDIVYPNCTRRSEMLARDFGLGSRTAQRIVTRGRLTSRQISAMRERWGLQFIYYIFAPAVGSSHPDSILDAADAIQDRVAVIKRDLTAIIANAGATNG
jgi:hypothetical protein